MVWQNEGAVKFSVPGGPTSLDLSLRQPARFATGMGWVGRLFFPLFPPYFLLSFFSFCLTSPLEKSRHD